MPQTQVGYYEYVVHYHEASQSPENPSQRENSETVPAEHTQMKVLSVSPPSGNEKLKAATGSEPGSALARGVT